MLRRVTTTIDSLAKIIQTLSQGSMSGQLIARRGSDISLEEGEIFFFHGKIVAAKAADRVGADALNWMNTWKDCTFSFHPSKESKHIPVLPPDVLNNSTNALVMGDTTERRQNSLVRKLVRENEKESETSKTPIVRPGALFPGAVPSNALAMRNTTELRQNSPMRKLERETEKESETSKIPIVRPGALFPGAVPYRTEANDKALQLLKAARYSRIHRHIFLLVNGHRSVVELIRLTGRDKEEVVKLLRDLEKLQIIHIPN